jgi:hypothetical protein
VGLESGRAAVLLVLATWTAYPCLRFTAPVSTPTEKDSKQRGGAEHNDAGDVENVVRLRQYGGHSVGEAASVARVQASLFLAGVLAPGLLHGAWRCRSQAVVPANRDSPGRLRQYNCPNITILRG